MTPQKNPSFTAEIPNENTVIERSVLHQSSEGSFTVDADDQQSAEARAREQLTEGMALTACILVKPGRPGIFGIGRKSNVYRIDYRQEAVVELVHAGKAKIRIDVEPKAKLESDEPPRKHASEHYKRASTDAWAEARAARDGSTFTARQPESRRTIVKLIVMTNREIPSAWKENYLRQILQLRTEYGSYADLRTNTTVIAFETVGELDFSDVNRVLASLLVSGNITDATAHQRMTFGNFDDGRGLRGKIVAEFNV